MKTCLSCEQVLDESLFYKGKAKCGLDACCGACHRLKSKAPSNRFNAYRAKAKERGFPFELTFEQFMTFWHGVCHYCDSTIDGIGIDRVDSEQGYLITNCVPCCRICNRAKRDFSIEDFRDHLVKLRRFAFS